VSLDPSTFRSLDPPHDPSRDPSVVDRRWVKQMKDFRPEEAVPRLSVAAHEIFVRLAGGGGGPRWTGRESADGQGFWSPPVRHGRGWYSA
jgi:hypothetical protein